MIKNKAILTGITLLLTMVLISPACVPAIPDETEPAAQPTITPVNPPATNATQTAPPDTTPPATTTDAAITPVVEKPTSFTSEKYTHPSGLSIRYPKEWTTDKPLLPTSVLHAHDSVTPLHNFIIVDIRPATNFTDAAIASLNDLIIADGLSATPTVELEKTMTLSDGKTLATEIIVSADVLFKNRKGYALGVIRDGQAYIVMAGLDPAKLDLFKEIVETMTF